MNLEFMKTFLEVARYKSITQAAGANNISQSALSQQINTLEKLLDTKLFHRTHQGVELTQAGKIMEHYTMDIVQSYDRMLHDIQQLNKSGVPLRIIASPTVCAYALPCTLFHIKTKFPTHIVELESMYSDKVEKAILQGFGDLGIVADKPNNSELIHHKVYSDRYYLTTGFDTHLPEKISITELTKFPILLLTQSHKSQQLLDSCLKEQQIDTNNLNVLFHLDTIESIKIAAIRNYGMAFLPYMSIKKELYNKQLRIIDLDDFSFSCDYYAIKTRKSCANSQNFSIISYIETIIQDTVC